MIGFTQRELARIVGKTWSGRTSEQLYHAMMQLRRTGITCYVQNKESKTSLKFDFEFVTEALFSCREEAITECVIQVSDVIVGSLNRHHAVWLNNTKLSTLDPIAAVFFKRLFYHFSNTYTSRKGRSTFKFEKIYEDVCSEWLGGPKPEKYKSRIEKQLGRYLDAIQTTDLIARYEIVPRAKGPGFKIVFHAGTGFFDDYEEFYLRSSSKPTIGQLPARAWLDPQPLKLVAYFHQLLGHKHDTFAEKEKKQASELLGRYTEREVRDLIDYAVARIKSTNFKAEFFGAVMNYQPTWSVHHTERAEIAQRRAAAAECPICQGRGWVLVRDAQGAEVARACNHGQAVIGSDRPTAH